MGEEEKPVVYTTCDMCKKSVPNETVTHDKYGTWCPCTYEINLNY